MGNNLNSQVRAVNKKLWASRHPVRAGAASALNKVGARIKTRVAKKTSVDAGIQQKNIKNRVYLSKSKAKKLRAKITCYTRDIPALSLGTAQTTVIRNVSASVRDNRGRFGKRSKAGKTAIRVGKRTYRDAFINRSHPDDPWQLFRRKGRARNPIEMIKVKVRAPMSRHTPQISRQQMQKEYPRIAQHEINYRMKKYASR